MRFFLFEFPAKLGRVPKIKIYLDILEFNPSFQSFRLSATKPYPPPNISQGMVWLGQSYAKPHPGSCLTVTFIAKSYPGYSLASIFIAGHTVELLHYVAKDCIKGEWSLYLSSHPFIFRWSRICPGIPDDHIDGVTAISLFIMTQNHVKLWTPLFLFVYL